MSDFDVALSDAGRDDEWDAFVERAPGGHHLQTSRWGEVKQVVGWRAVRSVVRRDGRIVAGCQLLLRSVGRMGALAYAPRGPLALEDDSKAVAAALSGVEALAVDERVRLLKLQPPVHRHDLAAAFERRGFRPSQIEAAPLATVVVDLRRDEDALIRGMRGATRRNIRGAQRNGVTIRSGSFEDLARFAHLIALTSRRQGFTPYPSHYYERMFQVFRPDGHAELLLAEHGGRVVSGALIVGFGDTAVYKVGAWIGERNTIHPNELLHWTAMQRARQHGHHFYDLEGIDPPLAEALLRGELPPEARRGTAHFKLGFGGEVRVFPKAYDRGRPRLLGAMGRYATPRARRLAHTVVRRG